MGSMGKRLKIGIVGCGAIGTSLAEAILSNFTTQVRLVSLYDIDRNKALCLAKRLKVGSRVSSSLDSLIQEGVK